MKTSLILLSLFLALTTTNQAQAKTPQKILVCYFSFPETTGVDASTGASRIVVGDKLYGNTEYVAHLISNISGADVFPIHTAHAYPNKTHNELVEFAKKEADAKTFPKITAKIKNFADYDVVFIGYPNWWYDMPRVIYTLLRDYDFSGKTIVPFCTHGGSGFSQSVGTIKKLEKTATILTMPAISNNTAAQSRKGLETWLKNQGFSK